MPAWVISIRPFTRHWRAWVAVGILLGLAGSRWTTAQAAQQAPEAPQAVFHVPTTEKWVALTFDDGPSPKYTPQILQLLAQYHDHATFFVLGQSVKEYPQIVRDEVAAGDEVANHTFSHVNLAHQSVARITTQLTQTQQIVREVAGVTPTLLRPPYGAFNKDLPGIASHLGLRVIIWSSQGDTRDWTNPGVGRIVSQALRDIKPGDIVLFHDGGGNRAQTVAALAVILKDLQARGYQAVTVGKLLKTQAPAASKASPSA